MSVRTEKIGRMIQKQLSRIISENIDAEEFGFITIVHVRVLEDLSEARVYISALENLSEAVVVLNKRSTFLQKLLHPYLVMKKTPKISFLEDTVGKHALKIEQLLHQS